jgi:hypothetical protein
MMTSGQNKNEKLYSGTMDCGRKILATEGVTGKKII